MEREDGLGVCVPEKSRLRRIFRPRRNSLSQLPEEFPKAKGGCLLPALQHGITAFGGNSHRFLPVAVSEWKQKESFLFLQHDRAYVCLEGWKICPFPAAEYRVSRNRGFAERSGTMLITVDEKDRMFFFPLLRRV